jgi:hypothetical protein
MITVAETIVSSSQRVYRVRGFRRRLRSAYRVIWMARYPRATISRADMLSGGGGGGGD